MARDRIPGGLRTRFVLAISLITIAVVIGSFIALERGTSADIQDRIDDDLREQYTEFRTQALGPQINSPAKLRQAAQRFIASQRYHPASRIFLVEIVGAADVTNEREVIEHEIEGSSEADREQRESDDGAGLLDAPTGLATVSVEEAGDLRVFSAPIRSGTGLLGSFRVADPLTSVSEARSGLRSTFLLVGLVALGVAIGIGIWVATLMTRPLRRMASVASKVDAGELAHRIDVTGGDEVGVLADAFNHMLDRLESAFRRQKEFVSDASHELRTPLTVLRGQIEALDREAAGRADRARAVASLLREVDRMNRLVDDLLMLAGAESGQPLERRHISLSDFFEDVRRDLPLLGARQYRVGEAPPGELEVDPDRLAQVLRNLVRNAVAHTGPDGQITITARARDGRVAFSVSDDGPGVPPEQLERLFDRFYRTDAGRARDEGGSGLGLAIARAIVEAHGGRIWAESSPGEGATFRFELPRYRRR
jgi:two-component system OmpR family sensor kinase